MASASKLSSDTALNRTYAALPFHCHAMRNLSSFARRRRTRREVSSHAIRRDAFRQANVPSAHRLSKSLDRNRPLLRDMQNKNQATWLSVNDAIEGLKSLAGKPVEIHGLLTFGLEEVAIWHFPKAERQGLASTDRYPSSLWIEFGNGSIRPNEASLTRWNGKRVAVSGILRAAGVSVGCGHFGMWPGEIEAYSIQRI